MTQPTRKPRRSPSADPFPAGTTIGAIQVLFVAQDAPTASKRSWWVRYGCCGVKVYRSYSTLAAAVTDPPQHCWRCARQVPRVARPRPRPRAAFTPARAWPRPASLAGQPPLICGAQS